MKRPRVDVRRLFLLAVTSFLLAKLAFLGLFAIDLRYVMDEFNLVSMGLTIPEGFYRNLDPIKTVLQVYYFDLARCAGGDAVAVMRLARIEGLAMALVMVALTYAITRRLGGSRAEALFATAVLLAFSNFLERSFRIRAESLAIPLPLLALYATARWGPRSPFVALVTGALVGGGFLATQKAAYYFIAFGAGYLVLWGRRDRPLPRAAAPGLLFAGGWCASVLGYSLAFGGSGFARVVRMIFTSPLQVAFHAHEYYIDLRRFVVQTLELNQLAYGLCLLGLALAAARVRSLSESQRFAWAVATLITALVFLHTQPWPYVFVMAIPFLAPWSVAAVRALSPEGEARSGVLLGLVALLSLSLARNTAYLAHDNVAQTRVMRQAESLLAPADRYADGVGMLPTRRWAGKSWVWDRMALAEIWSDARRGDLSTIDEIFADQPKLWIWNYRVEALRPLLAGYLDHAYVQVYPNVLLAGAELAAGIEADFRAWWGGAYRLYDATGRPLDASFAVDGQPARGEVIIAPGMHRLKLGPEGGSASAFLLPAGVVLHDRLPAPKPATDLFAGVYD